MASIGERFVKYVDLLHTPGAVFGSTDVRKLTDLTVTIVGNGKQGQPDNGLWSVEVATDATPAAPGAVVEGVGPRDHHYVSADHFGAAAEVYCLPYCVERLQIRCLQAPFDGADAAHFKAIISGRFAQS